MSEHDHMIQKQRFGAGCLFSKPEVFPSRAQMLDSGKIGHIQLMMIPVDPPVFREAIDTFEPYQGTIRIHAPHHGQQVNPCAPALYPEGKEDISGYIDEAMAQTQEAADRTGSEIIVLHAGRYLPGQKEEAITSFQEFLDRYPDRRYILESLPDLSPGPRYLGVSPEELKILGSPGISGFCADFPHLWCTSVAAGLPYHEILDQMFSLPVRFSHLSGSPGPHTDHQHLFLDDPDNAFSLEWIRPVLERYPNLEISLEFGTDDPAVIMNQIRIASS